MREEDLPKAEQVAVWLRNLGFEVEVVNLAGRWSGAAKVRPNTFEIWFGNAPLPQVCSTLSG
jgi:nitric oxide reductase large subunit